MGTAVHKREVKYNFLRKIKRVKTQKRNKKKINEETKKRTPNCYRGLFSTLAFIKPQSRMTLNKGKELSYLTRGLGHGAISAIHCCVPLAKPPNPAGQPTNPDFSPESPEPLKTSQSQEH